MTELSARQQHCIIQYGRAIISSPSIWSASCYSCVLHRAQHQRSPYSRVRRISRLAMHEARHLPRFVEDVGATTLCNSESGDSGTHMPASHICRLRRCCPSHAAGAPVSRAGCRRYTHPTPAANAISNVHTLPNLYPLTDIHSVTDIHTVADLYTPACINATLAHPDQTAGHAHPSCLNADCTDITNQDNIGRCHRLSRGLSVANAWLPHQRQHQQLRRENLPCARTALLPVNRD